MKLVLQLKGESSSINSESLEVRMNLTNDHRYTKTTLLICSVRWVGAGVG